MELEQLKSEHNISGVSVKDSRYVTFNQTTIIQISAEEIKGRTLNKVSPYKALEKFEPEDKDLFFGRDQFLTGLVNKLERTNLLLLLGASGSGKSSVIKAGLVPWLQKNRKGRFINLVLTPDQDPFEALYASLLRHSYSQSKANIARSVNKNTLTQVVHELKRADDFLLIFIDQFEELFTRTPRSKRDPFINGILRLLGDRINVQGNNVKVVATMRADFSAHLSSYPAFIKATDGCRPMLADMQADEIRLAIEQPAAQHGVIFESGLVEEIIKDVQGRAGYLPLLQYTLNLLWEEEIRRKNLTDRTLHKDTYWQLGGVRGALQQHLDKVYQEELSSSEQKATKKIFLRLVDIGENQGFDVDWIPVRRRAARYEFGGQEEQNVLNYLIDRNLLISNINSENKSAKNETVEIAHEALLTSWTTLNNWIKENRQAIALRNRLNDDLLQWKKTNSNDDLWSGHKLKRILELRRDTTFNSVFGGLSREANKFINKSDRRQRNRVVLAWGVIMLIVSIISVSVWQLRENRFQENFSAVLVGGSTNPDHFYVLDRALKLANREMMRGNMESASKTFQSIQTAVQRYKKAIDENSQMFKEKDMARLNEVWKSAENGLLHIVESNILKRLKNQLSQNQYGKFVEGSQFTDYEQQFTEGALQTTYQLLMRSPGFGADVNGSGILEYAEEAERMSCKILEILETLWRSHTGWRCGFYGDDDYYIDSDCPLGRTLTLSIFPDPLDAAINRIESCSALKRR